jgi:hypothetical protein
MKWRANLEGCSACRRPALLCMFGPSLAAAIAHLVVSRPAHL